MDRADPGAGRQARRGAWRRHLPDPSRGSEPAAPRRAPAPLRGHDPATRAACAARYRANAAQAQSPDRADRPRVAVGGGEGSRARFEKPRRVARPDDVHQCGEAVDADRGAHDLGRRARGALAASRRLLPAIGGQLRAAHRRRGRRPAGSFRRRLSGDRDPRCRRPRRAGRPRCRGSADRAERGRRRRRDGSRPRTRTPRDRRDPAGSDRPDRVRAAATADAGPARPAHGAGLADQGRRRLRRALLAGRRPLRRSAQRAGPGDDDLRQLAAGRNARSARRLRRRPRRTRVRSADEVRAPAGRARRLRGAVRPAREDSRAVPRAGLGRRALERRRAGGKLRHRWLERCGAGASGARRAPSTGPAPRPRPAGAAISMERSAPASVPRGKCSKRSRSRRQRPGAGSDRASSRRRFP